MLFSRVFTTVLTFGLASFVAASPVGITDVATFEKRDNAEISTVINTLKSEVDPVLGDIKTALADGSANTATVDPLLTKITASFNTAASSLAAIQPSTDTKRQSDDEIANLVAGLLTDVTDTLNSITSAGIISLVLPGLDASLAAVLKGLETLLAGVLNLVATLLVDVAKLLRSLALGLTLAALGL